MKPRSARTLKKPSDKVTPGEGTQSPRPINVLKKFRVIFRATKMHYQWVEQRCGISGAQLWMLSEVQESPGMRVSKLAAALAVHQSTASNMLEKLERRNLIRRERSENDQRVVKVFLTQAGRDLVEKGPRPTQGVLVAALDSMSKQSLAQLEIELDSVILNMKIRDKNGALTPLSEI